MENQQYNSQSLFEQVMLVLKRMDRQIDEWVNYFIDHLENVYH
jgi:hypothetical protein